MAVGFLAVFRGDRIIRGVAVTGTIEPDGRIGPVGGIPDKVRAAKRGGYRLVLVPAGQIRTTRWNLTELALELNITITEVETIDHAYELMTGRRLSFNDGAQKDVKISGAPRRSPCSVHTRPMTRQCRS